MYENRLNGFAVDIGGRGGSWILTREVTASPGMPPVWHPVRALSTGELSVIRLAVVKQFVLTILSAPLLVGSEISYWKI